jgi:fructose-bisphosphate aldolase, class II
MASVAEIIQKARCRGVGIPAFNIPYLPMMEPVVRAVADQDSFALVDTARLEWVKFESKGPRAVSEEFDRCGRRKYVRLHLDHVPVIDEDDQQVDYMPVFKEALALGYESVMVDGSRLSLEENIEATRQVADLAHASGIPIEAELGAVLGHESGPLPPYEELYASGRGFTDVLQAEKFVKATGCDWLSVAIGNIHGAIAPKKKDQNKVEARLNLDRLEQLCQAVDVPLVLHGGSSVRQEYLLGAMKRGIAKINVATEIRQAYEVALQQSGSIAKAQDAVYERTVWIMRDYLCISGINARVAE